MVTISTATVAALLTSAAAAGPASGTPKAHSFDGVPTVGALFDAGSSTHFCTASVIASPQGNLLVTAAHCIEGNARDLVFVPEYHAGAAPYGRWKVTGAYLNSQWLAGQSPMRDYAFLTVAARRVAGTLTEIQQLTGANTLADGATAREPVTVPAYPDGKTRPITCTSRLYFDGRYPAFNCSPYPGGTSGAPWLVKTAHGDEVVGVIGGLHQGGCQVYTSYSSPLGAQAKRTYDSAVAGTHPDTAPKAGSDGCSTGL